MPEQQLALYDEGGALVRYEAMCRAIDAAYEVDEVKEIRDRAAALEHYSRQAQNVEAEMRCCEIRLRAERKAGQLLSVMEKAKGAAQPGVGRRGADGMPSDGTRALSDLGITFDQSSQWQKLAKVPEGEFEAALAGPEKPTTSGIINSAFPPKPTPVGKEVLWLWGRLLEFDRMGLLEADPVDLLSTATDEMREDIYSLACCVSAWLAGIGDD